jgi:hypothetical protein
MKTRIRIFPFALLVISLLFTATVQRGNAVPTQPVRSITTTPPQYDDPYADFRNARYSNAGLLNEREEIKLGVQLHREVTKKYNLTDAGLDRVERVGQRCACRSALEPDPKFRDPES